MVNNVMSRTITKCLLHNKNDDGANIMKTAATNMYISMTES